METQIKSKCSPVTCVISIHKKWRNTKIHHDLKEKFSDVSLRDLGDYDFSINGDKSVVYITESDLVTNVKCDKFTKVNKRGVTFIAVRNKITAEQYAHLQDLICVKGDYQMIPVGQDSELPEMLLQLACTDSTITPRKSQSLVGLNRSEQLQSNLLLNIPNLGKTKADRLISTYGTIDRIASSSVATLKFSVGVQLATEIHKFFNESISF